LVVGILAEANERSVKLGICKNLKNLTVANMS